MLYYPCFLSCFLYKHICIVCFPYSNCLELSKPWFSTNYISICRYSQCLEPLTITVLVVGSLDLKVWSEQRTTALDSVSFYESMYWQICNQFWGVLLLLKVSHTFPCQRSFRAMPDYCWVQWECDLVPYPLNLCVGSRIGLS